MSTKTTIGNWYSQLRSDNYNNLTEEEEIRLGRKVRDEDDEEAKKKLVKAYLRWATKQAKDYTSWGIPLEDLVQAANEGLMEAVEKFDPDRGRLYFFAQYFVTASLNKCLAREGGALSLPATVRKKSYNATLFFKEIRKVAQKGLKKEKAIDKLENAMEKRRYWEYMSGYINKEDKIISLSWEEGPEGDVYVKLYDQAKNNRLAKNKFTPEMLYEYLDDPSVTLTIRESLRAAREGFAPALSTDKDGTKTTDMVTDDNIVEPDKTSQDIDIMQQKSETDHKQHRFLQQVFSHRMDMSPQAWKVFKLRFGLKETGDGRPVWDHILEDLKSGIPVLLNNPIYGLPTINDYNGVYEGLGILSLEVNDEGDKVYFDMPENMIEKNDVKFSEVSGATEKLEYPWEKAKRDAKSLRGELVHDGTNGRSIKEMSLITDYSTPAIHKQLWRAKHVLFDVLDEEQARGLVKG